MRTDEYVKKDEEVYVYNRSDHSIFLAKVKNPSYYNPYDRDMTGLVVIKPIDDSIYLYDDKVPRIFIFKKFRRGKSKAESFLKKKILEDIGICEKKIKRLKKKLKN